MKEFVCPRQFKKSKEKQGTKPLEGMETVQFWGSGLLSSVFINSNYLFSGGLSTPESNPQGPGRKVQKGIAWIVCLVAHSAWHMLEVQVQYIVTGVNDQALWALYHSIKKKKKGGGDFPGGTVDKSLPANAGDSGLIPNLGRLHV